MDSMPKSSLPYIDSLSLEGSTRQVIVGKAKLRRFRAFLKRHACCIGCIFVVVVSVSIWLATRKGALDQLDIDYTPKPEDFSSYDKILVD